MFHLFSDELYRGPTTNLSFGGASQPKYHGKHFPQSNTNQIQRRGDFEAATDSRGLQDLMIQRRQKQQSTRSGGSNPINHQRRINLDISSNRNRRKAPLQKMPEDFFLAQDSQERTKNEGESNRYRQKASAFGKGATALLALNQRLGTAEI